MRWEAFLGTTIIITIILFIQWPRIKKYAKKDKMGIFYAAFYRLGVIHVRSPKYRRTCDLAGNPF